MNRLYRHFHARVGYVCAALLLLLPAGVLQAQQNDRGKDGAEFEGFAGVYLPGTVNFSPGELPFAVEDQEIIVGGRLGYTFGINLFLQGEVSYIPLTMAQGGTLRNVNTYMYTGAVGYNFQIIPAAQLFILAGAGVTQWVPDGLAQEIDFQFQYGGGLRVFLTRAVAIRADVRDHLMPETMTDIRQSLNPGVDIGKALTHNIEVSAGITLFFPTNRDSDHDMVYNQNDACPNTPRGVKADAAGCPLDGDADGVPDYLDKCPNTPAGTRVNGDGCPIDSDGDGVPDNLDKCPNTPAGTPVNSDGCAIDTDGDGVPDNLDKCPNTPQGALVDEDGCPLDSDGDGVYDGLDKCPNTPADREVDENGCSMIEAGIEAGRLVLSSVYFRTNSATLLPASRRILDEVGLALRDRPNLWIEVQGYTDSTGSAAYNLKLSDERARSVYEYLVTTFPGLGRSRFTVKGYGEANPIASNETADGRSLNRRVEFVVVNQE
ncbi:MAG: OmpA family protein [Gemmatimonadota bacterium]